MRVITFERNGATSYGLLKDSGVVDVGSRLSSRYRDLRAVLAAEPMAKAGRMNKRTAILRRAIMVLSSGRAFWPGCRWTKEAACGQETMDGSMPARNYSQENLGPWSPNRTLLHLEDTGNAVPVPSRLSARGRGQK